MSQIHQDSIADIVFQLKWQSQGVAHSELYHASEVNIWRDWLPKSFTDALLGKSTGSQIHFSYGPGELLPEREPKKEFRIKNRQFDHQRFSDIEIQPREGRFYPKGLLKDLANVFRANITPFRCVSVKNGCIDVDFNHPLAGKELTISATVGNIGEKFSERGGASMDWFSALTEGPGMQTRWKNQPTDFFSDNPFERDDEFPDQMFYEKPRWVHHLDDTAREAVRHIHARFLKDDMEVLDLMSSWVTHLPENIRLSRLSGLGMNEEELKKNPALSDFNVHDLNENPEVPFSTASFDGVICTASVEYLKRPLYVFTEVARVLKPGGVFVVTFSDRWFPPKAIRIWKNLHEYERVGLVLEYFHSSGAFEELQTYSVRGLPRPRNDKYFPEMRYSDPIHGVWGRKSLSA
ncbi:MAG: hypothetical protein CSB33_01850 [Desulfobacterales bacterium]|nr:MAG: hypothetical protein CSB33_01850 [Desulfobacterales bacterium]